MRRRLLGPLVGLVSLTVVLLLAEGVVRLIGPGSHSSRHEALTPLYDPIPHPDYGYVSRSESTRRAHKGIPGGEDCYDVVYRTDLHGRRITSTQKPGGEPHLVLFGGSTTFGEGLADHDTLQQQLSHGLPDRAVYNYGFSGYGPSHALAKAQSRELLAELPSQQGDALYFLIPSHIYRVIGSTRSSWLYDSPHYVLDPSGGVVRRGSFRSSRPWQVWFHEAWSTLQQRSQLFALINLHLPLRFSDGDLDLLASILGELRETYRGQFRGEFSVVLHPSWREGGIHEQRSLAELRWRLDALSVPLFDYADYDAQPGDIIGDCDPHPSGMMNARLARWIARDLARDR
jgi:hypothetical protein